MSAATLKIGFFPLPAATSCCDTGGAAAACDCGTGDQVAAAVGDGPHPNEALMERVERLRSHYGKRVEVELASYTTNAGTYGAIDALNAALAASGKDFLVSPGNFYTFVGTVAPVVVVDGKIRFTRKVPDWEELKASVDSVLPEGLRQSA